MTKPYYESHKQFSSIIKNIVKSDLSSRGFFDHSIITDWATIVGEEMSKLYHPAKITFDVQKDRILWLNCTNLSSFSQFQYHKKNIQDKINLFYGEKKISDVKVKKPN